MTYTEFYIIILVIKIIAIFSFVIYWINKKEEPENFSNYQNKENKNQQPNDEIKEDTFAKENEFISLKDESLDDDFTIEL